MTFWSEEIFCKQRNFRTWWGLLLNNGAMDRAQKIKTGVLLVLAVASLALFILWVTDVIGLGLAVVLMIVMTAAEVPRVLFLGVCLDFYYCLRRVLVPKFGFHFSWRAVAQALVKPRLVPP